MIPWQFSLFGFQRPKSKVPISRERIEEAKRLFDSGDPGAAADKLREVREGLERYERRLNNKK